MRPLLARYQRQRQWAKLGKVMMQVLPMRSISASTLSGKCRACSDWVITTTSKLSLAKLPRPLSRFCSMTLTPLPTHWAILSGMMSRSALMGASYCDSVHIAAEGLQVTRDRDQEGVVALWRVDFQVADVLAGGDQGVDDLPRACRREAPVGGEGHHAEARLHPGQGLRQVAVERRRRVEIVQRLGHQQVGVGVETPGKFLALVAQVALDLELDAVEVVVELLALQAAAEFLTHGIVRQVGNVADHARQHQAALGDHPALLEVPA